MKFLIFILILIAEAPVFSGASAQLVDTFDFSSLVKIIKETDKPTKPKQTVPGDTTDVRTTNILNSIINVTIREPEPPKKAPSPLSSVLDFMTKVYAEHGFYQSGRWEDAEDWSSITRNITLPDYNPVDFYRPVWGQVTSTYGYRPKFGRVHKGIDLALHIGDTVRAALPGVVAKVAYDPGGYGHYVVLVHNNGMETRYAHLQAPISTLGETLSAGEPLGLGGNTGNSTGPHLHFEVRYRGTALDPASIFNFHNFIKKNED
ncbi:MAG: M23 family metallopeptidase [Muribaculaceae bacterium]|nr:M23 family metallopeptidase [Muribaculaceae bacterium]